jgi:hypothetical protein
VARTIHDDEIQSRILIPLVPLLPEISAETLSKINAIRDEKTRYDLLSQLAKTAPEDCLAHIFEDPGIIRHASVLSVLAQRLPANQCQQMLDMLGSIGEENRATVLRNLSPKVPIAIEKLWDVTLEIAQDDDYRTPFDAEDIRNLRDVAKKMSSLQLERVLDKSGMQLKEEHYVTVLNILLPYFNDEQLVKVLNIAQKLDNEWECIKILREIAEYLPAAHLRHVLRIAQNIGNTWARAEALTDIAKHIPEVSVEALDTARMIEDPKVRSWALRKLICYVPDAGKEALEAIKSINDEEKRAEELREVLRYLPKEQMHYVAEGILSIHNKRKRDEVIRDLVQKLPRLSSWVLDVSRAILDEPASIYLLSALAYRLPKSCERAIKITRIISTEEERAEKLNYLSEKLPW